MVDSTKIMGEFWVSPSTIFSTVFFGYSPCCTAILCSDCTPIISSTVSNLIFDVLLVSQREIINFT